MSVAVYCFILLLFCFLITRPRFCNALFLKPRTLVFFFCVKVIASFALVYIYSNYYPDRTKADLFRYFDGGNVIYSSIDESWNYYFRMISGIGGDLPRLHYYYDNADYWYSSFPLFNDARTVIRLNAVIRLFSFGSIHIHNLIFSFISFIGTIFIYKSIINTLKNLSPVLIAGCIFLFPSLLFWTSSAMKESLMILGIGLFSFSFFKLLQERFTFKSLFIFLFALVVLSMIKYYVLVCFLFPSFLLFIYKAYIKINKHCNATVLMVCMGAIAISLLGIVYKFIPYFYALIIKKRNEFIELAYSENAGSILETGENKTESLLSSLYTLAKGTVGVLFRPMVWEIKSVMYVMPAFESLAVLLMAVFSGYLVIKKHINIRLGSLTVFWGGFALQLLLIIGFTVPVLGAIVRYRLPVYLAIFIIFLSILDTSKLFANTGRNTSKTGAR